MTVRSAVLGRFYALNSGNYRIYQTPPGQTALVKSVILTNEAKEAEQFWVWVSDDNEDVTAYLFHGTVPAKESHIVSTWVVLAPTDQLLAYMPSNTDIWVSGAVLDGDVPIEPVVPAPLRARSLLVPPQGSPSAPTQLPPA